MDQQFDLDLENVSQLTRERVGLDTLSRYTGSKIEKFQNYILLTNFYRYLQNFSELTQQKIDHGSAMQACHCPKQEISLINFSVGSPNAALIIELLSFIRPKAVIMLGLCGGLRDNYEVGNYFNPVAAIRGEGTSNFYLPTQCPSLSSFVIQRYVCQTLEAKNFTYHNGVIHTTNVRFWEFSDEFKETLTKEQVQAIDMECATLFTVGFARLVPVGALMLISDLPLRQDGIKTAEKAQDFFKKYSNEHISTGVEIVKNMQKSEAQGFPYNF